MVASHMVVQAVIEPVLQDLIQNLKDVKSSTNNEDVSDKNLTV